MSTTSTSGSLSTTACNLRLPRFLLAVALLVTVFGCTQTDSSPYRFVKVADGFERPLYLTQPPGDTERLFVVEQITARIRIIRDGKVLDPPYLDIDDLVTDRAGEMGLLGLAFHPKYPENGKFYVNYIREYDRSGQPVTVVAEYQVSPDDPNRANPDSARILLELEQPYANHNGGMLVFGPDGYLYIGTGDGGSGGDPLNAGQRLDTLLGKILRIDVDTTGEGKAYGIPADNPFMEKDDALPEIYAYGLRNPWRFSYDPPTKRWFIGDVGQNQWEEVSIMDKPGQNFGWRLFEGNHCYDQSAGCEEEGLVMPIHEYAHAKVPRASVTGGFVYRGTAIPELVGTYLFADFTNGIIGQLILEGDTVKEAREITETVKPLEGDINLIPSFGQDNAGEIYIVDWMDGEVYRLEPRKP